MASTRMAQGFFGEGEILDDRQKFFLACDGPSSTSGTITRSVARVFVATSTCHSIALASEVCWKFAGSNNTGNCACIYHEVQILQTANRPADHDDIAAIKFERHFV